MKKLTSQNFTKNVQNQIGKRTGCLLHFVVNKVEIDKSRNLAGK